MSRTKIGQRIQELRKSAGLDQADVADSIGVSERQVQRIESGQSDPNTKTLFKISDAIGVSVWDLFPDDEFRSVRGAINLLLQFESLSLARKKVVLALIFRDPAFLSDSPGLAQVALALIKEEKPKK